MPDTLTAGESLSVVFYSGDHRSDDGWSLAYRFAAPAPITVAGSSNESGGFSVALSPAQTITLKTGRLLFDAIVTKTGESIAVDRGTINVLQSPLYVSSWQATLEAVDLAIAGFASNSNRSIMMGDMSITYRNFDELKNLRAFCVMQIARESGQGKPRIIRAVFS